MKKTKLYRYLGKNGVITTPVEILNAEHILMYHLAASKGKMLTDGEQYAEMVDIFAEDLDKWKEIGQDEIKQNN